MGVALGGVGDGGGFPCLRELAKLATADCWGARRVLMQSLLSAHEVSDAPSRRHVTVITDSAQPGSGPFAFSALGLVHCKFLRSRTSTVTMLASSVEQSSNLLLAKASRSSESE